MTQNRRRTGVALPLTGSIAALAGVAALTPTTANAQINNVSNVNRGAAALKILSPRAGDALGASTFSLDVSFQSRSKSPIVTAELYVDGVRWVRRNLDAPQLKNVLSFDVDATSLEEGTHAFLVKVYDAAGASAQTEIQMQAGAGGSALENFGPKMNFIGRKNGAKLSGTVEFDLEVESRNGINPYVSFYVDKQFKNLKNYPPYAFQWDTTTVANGFHTIEAMGYLETGRDTTNRRLRVYVDNAGGETKVKNEVADLSRAPKTVAPAKVSAAAVVASKAAPIVQETKPTLSLELTPARISPVATVARPEAKAAGLRATTVAALPVVTPIAPREAAIAPAPRVARAAVQPATKSAIAAKSVIGTMPVTGATAMLAMPAPVSATLDLAPVAPMVKSPLLAPAPVAPQRMTVAAPMPAVPMTSRAHHKVTKAAPAAHLTTLPTMANVMGSKAIQVAFDGQRIAFDVQPRIEAGMPVAPFRHIFEHTGGQVMWVPKTHIVRAVNADREIIIRVGGKTATVNGQQVTMDKAAFIEKGRTIVPLSFVGKSLDVNVKYDPATGHLDITSK